MQLKKMRQKLGLNQQDFWSRIGVTQSGGSRYETGRVMSKPVKMLITIAYGNRRDASNAVIRVRGAMTRMPA